MWKKGQDPGLPSNPSWVQKGEKVSFPTGSIFFSGVLSLALEITYPSKIEWKLFFLQNNFGFKLEKSSSKHLQVCEFNFVGYWIRFTLAISHKAINPQPPSMLKNRTKDGCKKSNQTAHKLTVKRNIKNHSTKNEPSK